MNAPTDLDPAVPPWRREGPRRPQVIVAGSGARPRVTSEAERLRPVIEQWVDVVVSDFEYRTDLSGIHADFAIVFGGDGSILRTAKHLGNNQIPVVGVNLGKLGFLADLSPDEFAAVLPQIVEGRCRVVEHLMLRCTVWRDGQLWVDQIGLNEAALLGGPPFSMLNVELYVDSILATTYSCDGLIISTPVGSTAHSLSAGGPILRKSLQAFVIAAISPHTLTVRPVVDSADRVFEMVVRDPLATPSLVVDGVVLGQARAHDRIQIKRAPQTFKMIEAPGHNYYSTLREKLGWSGNIGKPGST